MIVLALDLATNTGWAVDRDAGGSPLTGLYRLIGGGRDRGHAFMKFDRWLFDMARQTKAELIAFEAPIVGGAPTNIDMALLLIGLAAHVEMVAASLDIRAVNAAVSTVRKFFTGSGRPTNPKKATLDRCKQLRWDVGGDHNRADAAALWTYTKATNDRTFRVETGTPLFSGASV
jgi:hypothetical protein